MRYLKLGRSELEASVVGFGAWAIGGGASWGKKVDDQGAIDTVHAALDAGINFIDTAPAYGWGHSERVLRKALAGRRDEVVLATKCGLWWDDGRGSFFADFEGKALYRSLRPDTIAEEVERSLQNLGVDCIDLYQTHWPAMDPDNTPIAETMGALKQLQQDGKIREIGVCNTTPEELEENVASGPVATCQFRYSMLARDPDKALLPLCKKLGLSTMTYMTLEQGLLTGKVTMDTRFEEGDIRTSAAWNAWYLPSNRVRIIDLLEGWRGICEEHGCTLAQLVLAWTLHQDGVTHVLAGARRPDQISDTANAADLQLGGYAEDPGVGAGVIEGFRQ